MARLLLLVLVTSTASGSLLPRKADVVVTEARRQLLDVVAGLWRDLDARSDVLQGFNSVANQSAPAPDAQGVGLFLEDVRPWASTLDTVRTIEGQFEAARVALNAAAGADVAAVAEGVVGPRHQSVATVADALRQLHDDVVGAEGQVGLFDALGRAMGKDAGSRVCSLEQSPQQLIYNLYKMVALAELKGFAMAQFSWMILKQHQKGNFSVEADQLRTLTEKRSTQKAAAAQAAMRDASRLVWRCDPKQHEENVTFIQLTELLQGYVQNEVDLNPKSSCGENCAYYTYAKVHGCYHNQYCSKQRRCNGRVFNCQFIDSDSYVCPSDKPNRRYEFIEYENGRVLGKPAHCKLGTTQVDSWWRWLFWHCSYCFCLCDDDGTNSDRFFSLRPALANSSYAVTGLRFVKLNRVIHLQVQQGKVLPRGEVDVDTVHWKPVEAFDVTTAAPGRDYHKMDFEQRALDLDDLSGPSGYVLTGIKLRRIGSHLNAEILATPMDMETGELKEQASLWIGNDNTDAAETEPRTAVTLTSPDVSTRATQPSDLDSTTDQFVTFTNSDISKDAAQTTVPFLDAQPVEAHPPTLLAGAGLYHKGRRGYGGFVGLRLITYDFSDHLGKTDDAKTNLVN